MRSGRQQTAKKKHKTINFESQHVVCKIARLAQSAEHKTLNLGVGGSSPPSGL